MPIDTNSMPASRVHPRKEAVLAELQRVLDSTDFRSTPRRRQLLNYLIGELLAGRENGLKGYTIATVVFGRDENFDPQTDPIVRLEARRLRHDLDSYYVSAGRNNPLRITIPKGQYIPVVEEASVLPGLATPDREDKRQSTTRKRVGWPFMPAFPWSGVGLAGAALVVGLLLLGSMYWFRTTNGEIVHGPAIAVLPFVTYGALAKKDSLGPRMTDALIRGLDRFPDIRLYSLQEGDGNDADPVSIARDMGLDYLLDGTVILTENNSSLRVTARLLSVGTRQIVWIGEYNRDYSTGSLLNIEDDISASAASALSEPYGIIRNRKHSKLLNWSSTSSASYDCVMMAYEYRRSLSLDHFNPAIACLEKAVERDPGYADAWAMLGWLQMDAGRFGWAPDNDRSAAYERGLSSALHGLSLDGKNINALKALGSIYHYMGDFALSEQYQREALKLNPNDPDTLAQLGWRLAVRGNFNEGVTMLQTAIEKSANPPGWYYHLVVIDCYLKNRYDEMLKLALASSVDGSAISWSFVAIAEGKLGRKEEAIKALTRMAQISPQLARDPFGVYKKHQATDAIASALVDGLRNAGWQDPSVAGNSMR
jgi:TolB-like protein/Tfp pilus assembly protein PilF